MKICCIADTHETHRQCVVPDADVLIFAGDGVSADFIDWIKGLPHEHKLIVGGNHDYGLQNRQSSLRKQLDPCVYLEDESHVIDGIKFYGAPWNNVVGWAFYANTDVMTHKWWDLIPDDVDILITHTPPYHILDKSSRGIHFGCPVLADRIKTLNFKYHVFGHVHANYGTQDNFVNCSVCYDEAQPVVLEI
jgi:Icc-related predicted phosphoesterase